MGEATLFDEAWEQWRCEVTDSLTLEGQRTTNALLHALHAVGAFEAGDGLILRDWALGLMTREMGYVARLRAEGMDDETIDRLVALIQRHPTPAAGG